MLLYVMRHGDAMQFARTDAERPLSGYGRNQAAEMIESLRNPAPSHALVSPYLRAQETASIVCGGLGLKSMETVSSITPDSNPLAAVTLLESFEQHTPLLMVSHQPFVSSFISLLVDGDLSGGYMMGTASVACLQLENIGVGQAQLLWLRHAK